MYYSSNSGFVQLVSKWQPPPEGVVKLIMSPSKTRIALAASTKQFRASDPSMKMEEAR